MSHGDKDDRENAQPNVCQVSPLKLGSRSLELFDEMNTVVHQTQRTSDDRQGCLGIEKSLDFSVV